MSESSIGRLEAATSLTRLSFGWPRIDRRGLWTRERNELSDLIDYTRRIRRAAQRAREISVSFGSTGENWEPIIAEAGALLDRADELWDHRY